MYKLKRSIAAKIICFLLAAFFIFTGTLSALLAVYAFNTRDTSALSDKLFNSVYETISEFEARRLLNAGVFSVVLDNESESEFYEEHPYFSKERTNYSFTITDDQGKVLFYNFKPEETLQGYSGREVFYNYEDNAVEYGPLTDPDTTTMEEPTSEVPESFEAQTVMPESGSTEATSPVEESIEGSETQPEPTRNGEPENISEELPSEEEITNPYIAPDEQLYITDDRDEGLDSILMYVFPKGDFKPEIYNHCYQLYRTDYEPVEARYYRNGMYEVYHQEDFAVSENGFIYFIGEEREKSTEEPSPSSPVITSTTVYYINVAPDASIRVRDEVYYVSVVKNISSKYLDNINVFTFVFLFAAVLFTVLSFTLAGYVKDEDRPKARGIHKFPSDILILLLIIAISASVIIIGGDVVFNGYYVGRFNYASLTLPFAAVFTYLCLYMIAVKLKTKTVVSSLLCVKVFTLLKKAVKLASSSLNVLWKLGIFYVLSGIVAFIILAITRNDGAGFTLYIVLKVLELIPLLLIAVNLHTLQTGAKEISEGKHKPVSNRFLFGEFKKNAEYLNSINNGINIAVEERLKSESTKTELITNVSHDLKTPLTSIVNYIDLLKKEKIDNPKAEEYVEVIDRQSQKLKKLTTDIVDASKAAAGNLAINMEKTDIKVLLGQVIGEYCEKLSEKKLTLLPSFPDEEISVYADGRLLWRVFDNLMNNICKYSLENTRVYLTLTSDEEHSVITFKNISAEELKCDAFSLTDRFVRGDSSRNTEGSGLGLYIAKSLTENMGGKFDISTDGDLFKVSVTLENI